MMHLDNLYRYQYRFLFVRNLLFGHDMVGQQFFCANEQSQKDKMQMLCLQKQMQIWTYDEQRERGMRSISSLLIRALERA